MTPRKWLFALISVAIFVFVLSLRQLSDPDLGFHLKYGEWISLHQTVPLLDQSTYTVANHQYIDLHWLFQVLIYQLFRVGGYSILSLFFCFLSLMLFLLLLLRNNLANIPVSISAPALFAAFLILDPRIAPRPELLTFLFFTIILIILEMYYTGRKNLLPVIPVIMLIWCNSHALFVLGLILTGVYWLSISFRNKKFDRLLGFCLVTAIAICFINPYGIKGFLFPFELLTRFNPGNIYNQHIQEFTPFFAQSKFLLRDYLFLVLLIISGFLTIINFRKEEKHNLFLPILFAVAAIMSVRNIPLFILVALPVVCKQISILIKNPGLDARKNIKHNFFEKIQKAKWKPEIILFFIMLILPLSLIPRLITNAFYVSNESFNKTGMGINTSHQPFYAGEFLINHHLDGKMLNSIGFGGWLSWVLPQPVFIDGRLEVMQESLYKELTTSWKGGLSRLLGKYQPRLVCYNYLKYYPWTFQFRELQNWRLIYVDGNAAIFAENTYRVDIPAVSLSSLPLPEYHHTPDSFQNWIRGFYQQTNLNERDSLNIALLSLYLKRDTQTQSTDQQAHTFFNAANERYRNRDIHGALAFFDSAISLKPQYAKAYNNRGIIRAIEFRDMRGAIADFDKAIEIDPDYGDAYFGRGSAYFNQNELEKACRDWQKARSLGNINASRLLELHCARK
ncbi:MAG: tetratricopeptide repeat protein [Bacteroidetes bacterium]|nr:tetratricopeptide repeat protein [Bacteroidota bacterium]